MCDFNNTNDENTNMLVSIPEMNPLDVAEQVQVMRLQEESAAYKCTDFFAKQTSSDCTMKDVGDNDDDDDDDDNDDNGDTIIDAECRRKMCEWCFQVVDFCKFRRETVDIAMSLVDRFLSQSGPGKPHHPVAAAALTNKRLYQLIAMTALYTAIKLNEPMEMETSLMAELSRGEYTAGEISDMERTMLKALHWRVSGPTRLTFGLCFLALLPAPIRQNAAVAQSLLELVRFQTEVATTDYYFTSQQLPSTAALAIVLNAMQVMNMPTPVVDDFMQSVIRFGGMNPFSDAIQETCAQLLQRAAGADAVSQPFLEAATNNTTNNLVASSSCPTTTTTTVLPTSDRSSNDKDNTDNNNEGSPVCVSRTAMQQ